MRLQREKDVMRVIVKKVYGFSLAESLQGKKPPPSSLALLSLQDMRAPPCGLLTLIEVSVWFFLQMHIATVFLIVKRSNNPMPFNRWIQKCAITTQQNILLLLFSR